MKLALGIILAVVALAACAPERARPLPAPARWVGGQIWVPKGDAEAMATAFCDGVQTWGYDVQHWAYPYKAYPLEGGEIVTCEEGIREDFTSGR